MKVKCNTNVNNTRIPLRLRTLHFNILNCVFLFMPSVIWHCWLGTGKRIQSVKIERRGAGMVVCLEHGAYGLLMVHPFCQIDIIGAVMTVWRVRGKIVRSVLCSIVCNNSAQCSAYTWTDLLVFCWLDLAFLWLYCVLQFTCVRFSFLGLFCVCYSLFVYVCICCIRYSFFGTMPRDWLGRTSPKWPILYWVGHKLIMLMVPLMPLPSHHLLLH